RRARVGYRVAGLGAGEDGGVEAEAAVDRVVSAAAGEHVGGVIAENGVVPAAPDRVLDGRAKRDRGVAGRVPGVRGGALVEIDELGLAVARAIQGVGPARVPDAILRHAAGRERIDRSRGAAEAVGRVVGPGRGVDAIELLQLVDVEHHRRVAAGEAARRLA